jgi:hypothetical protein
MPSETSVVTPERYSQGFDYMAYMNEIKVNKARFEGFYDSSALSEEDSAAFRELASRDNGPKRMLVLGEDWCGDVVRGLGVLARICEAADMEMRIFPRDSHHDIMNEFLKEGLYMSIPVAVFYDQGHEYICHWIERSEAANREQGEIEAAIRAEDPEISDQDFGRQRRARTAAKAADWQSATVDELVGMLREHAH